MNRDPKGYYKRLELTPDASEKQIKDAFRRLAKKYHPDLNSGPDSKQIFQAISEAYEVLCNATTRAKYDNSGHYPETVGRQQNSSANEPPPEPIKCGSCGKFAAQPRYVIFWKITSLLIVSIRTPIQGIFCRQCAKSAAFKASVLSALFGWWSIRGLISTPITILRNALGGEQDKYNNERIAYFNAIVFFRRGQYDLAYALANPLRKSAFDDFSNGARFLCQIIEREQLTDTARELKDPWIFDIQEFLKNVMPGTAVVMAAIAIVLIYSSSQVRLDTSGLTRLAAAPQSKGVAPLIPTSIPPACSPPNGTILAGYYRRQNEGHSIQIQNGAGNAAIVKLKDAANRTYLSFYVRKNATVKIEGLQDGQYKIQFANIDGLSNDCQTPNRVFGASEFPTAERLTTEYSGGYVQWTALTYTLYAVSGGNVRTQRIDATAFARD